MSFLLDTNTCSAYLKNRRGLAHRFVQHSGQLRIASIILGELYTWAYRRPDPAPTLKAIADDFCRTSWNCPSIANARTSLAECMRRFSISVAQLTPWTCRLPRRLSSTTSRWSLTILRTSSTFPACDWMIG